MSTPSSGGNDTYLTDQEAYAGILLVAVAADGQITAEEKHGINGALKRMKLFEGWDNAMFEATLKSLVGTFRQIGMAALVARCAENLPEDLRLTAFANACDLVCADGVIEGNEQKFLEDLYQWLNLKPETATTLLKAMIIKNRG